jgi:hypothetical protein
VSDHIPVWRRLLCAAAALFFALLAMAATIAALMNLIRVAEGGPADLSPLPLLWLFITIGYVIRWTLAAFEAWPAGRAAHPRWRLVLWPLLFLTVLIIAASLQQDPYDRSDAWWATALLTTLPLAALSRRLARPMRLSGAASPN